MTVNKSVYINLERQTSIVWNGMNLPDCQRYMTESCWPSDNDDDDDDDDDDVLDSERADATTRK